MLQDRGALSKEEGDIVRGVHGDARGKYPEQLVEGS